MNGAGGSSGGIVHFFIGVIMMCGGFYMLLKAITVSSNFGLSSRLLTLGSITALNFGVISSVRFNLRTMTTFELFVILIPAVDCIVFTFVEKTREDLQFGICE